MDAKICGIKDSETLNYIVNHKNPPKYIGFITNYPKSKRYVDYEKLKKLTNINKKNINFVSVLVDPNDETLDKIKNLNFDYYQLYNVSPKKTRILKEKCKVKIITALTIKNKNDIEEYKKYESISEIILFDGKGYEKSIGFNHKYLNKIPNDIQLMIAGNIKFDNIPNLNNTDYFIDLSGSLENVKGKKDLKKIDYFLKNTKIK